MKGEAAQTVDLTGIETVPGRGDSAREPGRESRGGAAARNSLSAYRTQRPQVTRRGVGGDSPVAQPPFVAAHKGGIDGGERKVGGTGKTQQRTGSSEIVAPRGRRHPAHGTADGGEEQGTAAGRRHHRISGHGRGCLLEMPGGRTENGRGRRCHGRTRRRQTAKERKEVMDEHRHILYAQIRLWTDSGLQRENAMRGGVLLPKRKEVASCLPYSLPGCPCPQSGIRAFVHTFPVVHVTFRPFLSACRHLCRRFFFTQPAALSKKRPPICPATGKDQPGL